MAVCSWGSCGDDPGKRPIGASCGSDADCASGICGGDRCLDPAADTDLDGLTNQLESSLSTDPTSPDSDGDGKPDPIEVGDDFGNPSDQDADGKLDAIESAQRDADSDCISDERDPRDDVPETDLTIVADRQCCCAGRCSTLSPPLTPSAACDHAGATSTAAVLTCTPGGAAAGEGGSVTLYPCDGTIPSCDELDDGCNEGRWDATASMCVAVPTADTADCDDGNACTMEDECAQGSCIGIEVSCDDDVACTIDSCDAAAGCRHDLTPCECSEDSDCSDADACSDIETCDQVTLSCVSGTPVDCSSLADQCNTGACDARDGQCVKAPVADTTGCDDGDACTADDRCSEGGCSGTPVSCDDGSTCSVDSCDPRDGCRHDNTPCDALTATVVGATQIDLSWTYSGEGATGFEIECDEAGTGFTQVAVVDAAARSYSVTGLEPGTDYLCRVRAVVGEVPAAWLTGPLVTTDAGLPTDPSDVTLTVISATQIDVAWVHDGVGVSGFEIEADESGMGFSAAGVAGPNDRTFSHTDLIPSTGYAYRVTAINEHGGSRGVGGGPVTTLAVQPLTGVTLPNSLVTLKDAAGAERTATSNGGSVSQYTLDVSGLTPPFLLRVDGGAGRDLFGVALGPGVANINLFSDLLIGGWCQLAGTLVEDAFALDGGAPIPTRLEIDMLTSILRDITLRTLILEGVDVKGFDVITTLYPADGTGIDAVLGLTTVSPDRAMVTIADADAQRQCQQATLVTWEFATSLVTLDTTTSCSGSRQSSSTSSGIVPTTQQLRDAVAAVDADLAFLASTVNTRGANLRASDFTAAPGAVFFHADFLHDGVDAGIFAAQMASVFRGVTIEAFSTNRVLAFDGASGLITVEAFVILTAGGESAQERFVLPFIDLGADDWIFHGNHRSARSEFDVEMRTHQGAFASPTRLNINVDVRAPAGLIAAVEIMESAGNIFPTFTAVPSAGFIEIEYLLPDPPPAQPIQVELDVWITGVDLANPADLPLGTVFTFRVTPTAAGVAAGLGIETWQGTVEGVSNELVTITQPTGSTLAAATLGSDLSVQWSALPVSHAITAIELGAFFHDVDRSVECKSDHDGGVLGPTSRSGTIPMLLQCDGKAIDQAGLSLGVDGPHGERTHVVYSFENP